MPLRTIIIATTGPRQGFRFATSTGGVLTGRGADIILIDDPLKRRQGNFRRRAKPKLKFQSARFLLLISTRHVFLGTRGVVPDEDGCVRASAGNALGRPGRARW
jgi:hypothetical protein